MTRYVDEAQDNLLIDALRESIALTIQPVPRKVTLAFSPTVLMRQCQWLILGWGYSTNYICRQLLQVQ